MADGGDLIIRPMQVDDVETVSEITFDAFRQVDLAFARRSDPEPPEYEPRHRSTWIERTRHFVTTDPGGCWIAERHGQALGFAVSYRRDLTWFLATYAVRPGHQGAGVGKAVLDAALTHAHGCLRGMLAASDDPKALRRYRLAGFALHPQLCLTGVVDRRALPEVRHVREGTEGDRDLLDSLDRRLRDAAHGPDHEILARQNRLIVVDRPGRSGYAYAGPSGAPVLVAATDRRTASDLAYEALAAVPPGEEVGIYHVTAANDWALDVGVTLRLAIGTMGHLALRGMKPPVPYLHHGSFL